MAYNPIAPTSSRENRKRPTNIPQGAVLIVEDDGSLWMTTEETEGVPFVVDGLAASFAAMVADTIVAISS